MADDTQLTNQLLNRQPFTIPGGSTANGGFNPGPYGPISYHPPVTVDRTGNTASPSTGQPTNGTFNTPQTNQTPGPTSVDPAAPASTNQMPGPMANTSVTAPTGTNSTQTNIYGSPGNGWDTVQPGTADDVLKGALSRGMTGQAVADYVNQYFPGTVVYDPNFKGSGFNVYGTPAGYVTNEGGGWNYVTRSEGSGSGSGSGGTSPVATLPSQATQPYQPSQQYTDLYNLLMQQAGQVLNPDNATVKAQTDAYAAQDTRAMRNALTADAEKNVPGANVTAQTRAANEQVGQDTSNFKATAMQNELTAERQQIAQALSGAEGMVTSEQANELTLKLKQIDAALSQMGLQQGAYQFDTNTGLRLAGF